MTVYDGIKELSFEKIAEFLLVFANETIERFSNFQMPSKDVMYEFLKRGMEEQ